MNIWRMPIGALTTKQLRDEIAQRGTIPPFLVSQQCYGQLVRRRVALEREYASRMRQKRKKRLHTELQDRP